MFRTLGLRHLCVINKYNQVLGVVTRADLVRGRERGREREREREGGRERERNTHSRCSLNLTNVSSVLP
jgi:CBS-domain-containing membrane protein